MTYLLLFIIGLCFGSFLSALTYRLVRNISINKGRSFCPRCKHQIAWYDNIPLISYLLLGGKCRNCKKHISIRYPLIETVTGIGFVLIFVYSPNSPLLIITNLVIFCILLSIFVTDIEHQIIPDELVFEGVMVFLMFLLIVNDQALYSTLFSGFLAASLLIAIHLLTKGRGMGLGDVKFAVLGGFVTGLNLMPVWLLLSFLTGGMAGIILILIKKAGLKDKIAFGPFLIVGLAMALLWGEKILKFLI